MAKKMICDILRGSKNGRLLRLGLDRQSTYGIMKNRTEKSVRDMIDCLEQERYIATEGTEYPVLKITASSHKVLQGRVSVG